MDLLSPIKDHHSERRLFIARVVLTSVISVVLLGLVIARLVQLQVFDHESFAAQSQGNRVRIEPVPPIRGLIFDRKGRVLAENLPAYQLELIPEQVADGAVLDEHEVVATVGRHPRHDVAQIVVANGEQHRVSGRPVRTR